LPLYDRLKGSRGGAVATPGVEVYEINFCHKCFISTSYACHTRAVKG
jgi:hypothetical protein